MASSQNILGIDIGSVSVSLAEIDTRDTLVRTAYVFHHGDIDRAVETALENTDLSTIAKIAVTSDTPSYIQRDSAYDQLVAVIKAARYFHPDIGALLNVGGEKFNLSLFDDTGNYSGSRFNTSCAAGTGSFLDQQAVRLDLSTSENLSKEALSNNNPAPDIATRCAVFAKTDLIHAQQEGYAIAQISDGLCRGLAKNIYNTLFSGTDVREPVVFCGGVAQNDAVKAYLEELTGCRLTVDTYCGVYGAVGAALCLSEEISRTDFHHENGAGYQTVSDLFIKKTGGEKPGYPGLKLVLSDYPDFAAHESFVHENVETDIYLPPEEISGTDCYIGIDVGSTSTKSAIVTARGEVVAGFYTKTASRPVSAVQSILKAQAYVIQEYGFDITVKGCGTTGSGRKLSGKIVGADAMPDEITAHAKAAVQLNPSVDTIIEIGGQDAKFTTLKDGYVTSSVMNTICAAGTGSFIEEQAFKLGCPLSQYSQRTEGIASPVSSDRCTVFMERDMNHFLATGYNTNEVLASALHSVRDNYLAKVASEGKIGHTVLFQGATAKNKALVAAFEQKLEKPLHVSRYCHLTGAIGVALLLKEEKQTRKTAFRGFDLWKKQIPVRQETCRYCTNHCKITIAEIDGETEAFGFLCQRDLDTPHYIPKAATFNLVKKQKKICRHEKTGEPKSDFTVGLPAALNMVADLDFWKTFFGHLGIRTVSSEHFDESVKLGKTISSSEFCTPILSLHGHVARLMEKADFVFLPFYFEEPKQEKGKRRQHCYYTQFSPSVIGCCREIDSDRLISPLVNYLYTSFHTKMALYKALKRTTRENISFFDIASAWEKALDVKKRNTRELKNLYLSNKNDEADIQVALVGRPYTILSDTLNGKIPDIFASLDIKAFFQDMLDFENHDFTDIEGLLKEIHWKYAATILKATHIAAVTDNLYPVYITSFNCSPDAFCLEYFKQIMEESGKPYLVLELDEHDSSVGYETRIEAAVRAFRNHKTYSRQPAQIDTRRINPDLTSKLKDKTVIFPHWDSITGAFLVSILKSEGYNAFLMEETDQTIKASLKTNTGQCIPLNAMAEGFMRTIDNRGLDPSSTALWLSNSEISCNIKLYPHHIKHILKKSGQGYEKAQVYVGELSFIDISLRACINTYFAYMFGGLIRKIGCRLRPYETVRGETDQAVDEAVALLEETFEKRTDKEEALSRIVERFSRIETRPEKRPKVGIFGDLYVRDNEVANQNLIRFIEENGGEVVPTPYYRYVKMIAPAYFSKWFKEGRYMNLISNRALFTAMRQMEKKYYKYFNRLLNEEEISYSDPFEDILEQYHMIPEHTGESMDNILKIHYVLKEDPDISLFVQTSPSFCCPSLVTESMADKIKAKTGVPVVSITYDVSGGNKNNAILPFLKFSKKGDQPHTLKESV